MGTISGHHFEKRWHRGLNSSDDSNLFPGHFFVPIFESKSGRLGVSKPGIANNKFSRKLFLADFQVDLSFFFLGGGFGDSFYDFWFLGDRFENQCMS